MKFSDDRIADIARKIHTSLQTSGLIEETDVDKVQREIKRTLIEYLKVEEAADDIARQKVASLKRGVQEGSREWEVLYRKYFEEEMHKKGRG